MSSFPVPAAPEVPVADPCDCLLDVFSRLDDPRQARGKRHSLASVLALCVVAMLAGCQNLTQIRRYGNNNPEVLKALGFGDRPAPVTTTLSTLLGAVRIGQLQEGLAEWLGGLLTSIRFRPSGTVASVDGKTSRASKIHVLNVFSHSVSQVLWQSPVDVKANEIVALREALATLFEEYPFLKILTGDAMFAGNPLCSEIIRHGRHYIFQIKGDQKHLHEKLELVFARCLSRPPDPTCLTGEKKRLCCGARGVRR